MVNEDAVTRHIGRRYMLRDFFKSGVDFVFIETFAESQKISGLICFFVEEIL